MPGPLGVEETYLSFPEQKSIKPKLNQKNPSRHSETILAWLKYNKLQQNTKVTE